MNIGIIIASIVISAVIFFFIGVAYRKKIAESKIQSAEEEAKKIGNSRVFNLIVLGVAAQHMDFTKEQWYEEIEKTVPPKTIEINKKAFDVGYHL